MRTSYTIKIKKRSLVTCLVALLVVMPFLFAPLTEWLKLPGVIRYLPDLVWISLFALMLCRRCIYNRSTQHLFLWIAGFALYTVAVYLVQYQSGLYYLWGFRNNFRFYAAFLAFAVLLTSDAVEDLWNMLGKLFWLNAFVSIIQFLFLEQKGDQLGGLFSSVLGGNGYTNIFHLLIVTRTVVMYLEKRESMGKCIAKCLAALLIAALAEQKFFYIEFLLVVALAVLFSDFTWRKFWLLIGSVVAVFAGAALLAVIFPRYAGFLSVNYFLETASSSKGYTGIGDVNRLNAFSTINELWLKSPGQQIFGLGLGNCDTSGFAFLNTPFYQRFEDYHFYWLSYSMMYLECGWIGLGFYFGFFILVWLRLSKLEKRSGGTAKSYCRIARIISALCCVVSVYNSSLRTEAAYLIYFALAAPFALDASYRKQALRTQMTQRKLADHE